MKNPSVDLVKGLLILLVMVGHAMELTHQQHEFLWLGAGFRMPLMIGISGYLLNVTRTRSDPPALFFSRYADRMLLPWAVALLVYVMIGGGPIDWTFPIDLVLRPPFHLWYVPVLFVLIALTRFAPFPPVILLMIGVPVSLAIMYRFGLGHGPIGSGPLAIDSRYLRYPVYFFFGMLVAERGLPDHYRGRALLLIALGMVWWIGLYGSHNGFAFVPARLIMCLGMIALLPLLSAQRLSLAPLNAIGRDSLFFYLWHPLVMGLTLQGAGHAATIILSSILLLAVVRLIVIRYPLLRRLLGVSPPRLQPEKEPMAALTAVA